MFCFVVILWMKFFTPRFSFRDEQDFPHGYNLPIITILHNFHLSNDDLLFFLHLLFTFPKGRTSGLITQLPVGQIPIGEQWLWTRTLDRYTRTGPPWNLWSAECQGHRKRQHRTEHKVHTPSPRIEIKIPEPAGIRTRAAGTEGRDPTDNATAADSDEYGLYEFLNVTGRL